MRSSSRAYALLSLLLGVGCVSDPGEPSLSFEPVDGGVAPDAGATLAFDACGFEGTRYALKAGDEHSGVCAHLLLDHAGFRQGSNDFAVSLSSEENARKADLVSVSAFMPTHGHGTSARAIEPNAAGYCVSQLPLVMAGRWEVTLTIRTGVATEQVVIPIDVR